jgi:hypothetical protein
VSTLSWCTVLPSLINDGASPVPKNVMLLIIKELLFSRSCDAVIWCCTSAIQFFSLFVSFSSLHVLFFLEYVGELRIIILRRKGLEPK